jgi:hypothetical protein
MSYYHFLTEGDLDRIQSNGSLLPHGHNFPYKPDQIVCVFESDDLTALFNKYGRALSEKREIPAGKKLIVVEVAGIAGQVELDKSQINWPESRALFGPISREQLRIVAQAVVLDVRGGQVILGPLKHMNLAIAKTKI